MALTRIQLKPGINREGTELSTGPGYYDCDKLRFRKGLPESIGGWAKYSTTSFLGVARSLFDWGTAASIKYLGIGTNLKFYVEQGNAYYDITPIRLTTAAGDVTVSATNGSSTLTFTENAHGAVAGDYVTFSGLVTLGGNITAAVLNQEYRIATAPDSNTYTAVAKDTGGATVTANASDTGNGGASGVAEYQINTGTNSYVPSTGYGVGPYGAGPYGGGGSLAFSGQIRLYSQSSFGDDLIFNARAGGVYFWDESAGTSTRAVALPDMPGASDAPVAALQVMVSPADRHVICFGVNPIGSVDIDPLLVRWSDQENAVDWTPSAINTAGGKVLSSGTEIIGAIRTRQEKLIFTDSSIHSMRFSGAPFVYQIVQVGEDVSIVGPKAAAAVGDSVYFMDNEGFYVYRGAVQRLKCDVQDYVFSGLDKGQGYKVFAANNPDYSEVTWYYPAGDSQSDVNRYVTYNYSENIWTIGALSRGAWISGKTREYPLASSNDVDDIETNYLFNHEFGYDADGDELLPYFETGRVLLGDGESLMFCDRAIPDFRIKGNTDNFNTAVIINGNKYPMKDMSELVRYQVMEDTGQMDIRFRAREITIRVEGSGLGHGWTMGVFRLDLRTDGKR